MLGASARAFLRTEPTSRLGKPAGSVRSAVTRSFDRRELVTLLLLPFFLLAFGLVMSQSLRQPMRAALEAPATPDSAEPAIASVPPALAPLVPAIEQPAAPATQVINAVPHDARSALIELSEPLLQLPLVPPNIESAPLVELASSVLVLPLVAPTIEVLHVEVAAPALTLPSTPLDVAEPEVVITSPQLALAVPAPTLPQSLPAVVLQPALVSPDVPSPVLPAPLIQPEVTLAPVVPPASKPPALKPEVASHSAALPELALAMPGMALPLTPPAVPLPVLVSPDVPSPVLTVPQPPPSKPQRESKLAPVAHSPVKETLTAGSPRMCHASPGFGRPAYAVRALAPGEDFGERLAIAAREQTSEFVVYNDAYRRIAFPMGDVNPMYGVCTDVLIRAYRAVGVDLQEQVAKARVGSGDTSIQHRRVDTLRKFFKVKGASLPITSYPEDYRPGDVVSYYRPQNAHSRTHIAIVSDVVAPSGRLMIVHNRGWGPQLEDALFVDQITGHYRYLPVSLPAVGPVMARPGRPAVPGGTAQASRKPATPPVAKSVVRTAFVPNSPAQASAAGTKQGSAGQPPGR